MNVTVTDSVFSPGRQFIDFRSRFVRAKMDLRCADWGHLTDVKVTERHRGKGIGTAFMREIIDYADARGIDLDLDCFPNRVAFYERLGFTTERLWYRDLPETSPRSMTRRARVLAAA